MNGLDWMADANCLDEDPELFFLGTANANAEAKKVCAGCDVRAQCDQYAKDLGVEFGVWGKTTERERAARQPRRVAQVPECGTRGGYQRHQKRKERACEPCMAANRVYAQAHYQANDHRLRNLA